MRNRTLRAALKVLGVQSATSESSGTSMRAFDSQDAIFQFALTRGGVEVALKGYRINDPDVGHAESQDFADSLSYALGLVFGR